MSHREINEDLGLESTYTRDVEDFFAGLDPAVASLLQGGPRVRRVPHGLYRRYHDASAH